METLDHHPPSSPVHKVQHVSNHMSQGREWDHPLLLWWPWKSPLPGASAWLLKSHSITIYWSSSPSIKPWSIDKFANKWRKSIRFYFWDCRISNIGSISPITSFGCVRKSPPLEKKLSIAGWQCKVTIRKNYCNLIMWGLPVWTWKTGKTSLAIQLCLSIHWGLVLGLPIYTKNLC